MDSRVDKASQVTILGFLINILLVTFKLVAGLLGHSTAIIADAFHSFSDLTTDLAIFWGVRAADRPADRGHHYGHGKIETLVSMAIGILLLLAAFKILSVGIGNIVTAFRGESLPRPGWIAVFAAALSIILKEWMYRRTVKIGTEIDSDAVVANAWHHRSDAFSSIGVLAGITGAIILGESWRMLDPLAAVIVSFFIFPAGIRICYEATNELLEASLSPETEAEILRIIRSVPGAENPHNLKTRRIGNKIAIEIHVRVAPTLNIVQAHDISTQVEKKLKERFGAGTFISVHVEPLKERKAEAS